MAGRNSSKTPETLPRFVHEFALAPTPAQARILRIRLDLGRQIYNAMLGEATARLNRCKTLYSWKQAMALFKQARARATQKDEVGAKALRAAAKRLQGLAIQQVMREERARYAPTSMAQADRLKDPAPAIMTRLRHAHFRDHLDFKSVQAMAVRAYQAVDQLRFKRPTRRRDGSLKFPRVHFVRHGEARALDSTSIHWRGNAIEWNSPLHRLQIPVNFDAEDTKGMQAHALAQMRDSANICESLRVLTRTVRGAERWYVQVTIKGRAAWKTAQYPPGHGKTIGIDFGPSRIGLCWEDDRGLLHGAKLELAEGLRHDYARIRRLQRYLDRSRRATNPDNYNADGTIKRLPGQRLQWHASKRCQRAKARLADLWRRYAARRKHLLGRLANEIIAKGTLIKIEDLSYKAWQRQWGKSIGRGAPGMLVRLLTQKAELVGGSVREFPTRHTKFSQLCHGCGTYTKKPLSQRIHRCACGVGPLDRDIYSAFLAYHYDVASQALDIGAARATFAGLQSGAVDVHGFGQAACVRPSVAAPSSGATGDCGGSSADRALALAETSADLHADGRRDAIPPLQGSAQSADSASVGAGRNISGDARGNPTKDHGHGATPEEERTAPRRAPPGQRSQKATQLSLFQGLPWPGG